MYSLYQVIVALLTPLIRLYWWRRSWRDQRYGKRLYERFGYYPEAKKVDVWVHAASVGESKIALQVVRILRGLGQTCVVTTQTPTGLAILLSHLSDDMQACHAPMDRYDCVSRFLNTFKPKQTFLIETEVWPGWLRLCQRRAIPVWVLNARCREKKYHTYRRIGIVWPFVQLLSGVIAVTERDAECYRQLGVQSVHVIPNLKWAMKRLTGKHCSVPMVCAGSVHKQEIFELLSAWHASDLASRCRLVLVPRHLDHLDEIDDFMARHGYCDIKDVDQIGVTIIRQMGVLMNYYQHADVCIVGGSFIAHGGQNPLEPAACGKPIVMGTSTYNFTQPVQALVDAGGLVCCDSVSAALDEVGSLLNHPDIRASRGQAAEKVLDNYQMVICDYEKMIASIIGEVNAYASRV